MTSIAPLEGWLDLLAAGGGFEAVSVGQPFNTPRFLGTVIAFFPVDRVF
jgi:hypothetical protein